MEKDKLEENNAKAEKERIVKEKEAEEIKEEDDKEYIYAYGITNNQNINLNIKGLEDKPLKKFNFRDITALISSYPKLNPILKENEAMKHSEVINKIAEKATVIPLSFGMVFKDRKILGEVLSTSYQAVKKTLELIKNKIELGVKVVKNQSDSIPEEFTQEILESLGKLSISSVKGENFSERLLLNHSFLVEKNNFGRFSNKIAALENKYQNLKFIYTGPWPPYSFVNIKIKGS